MLDFVGRDLALRRIGRMLGAGPAPIPTDWQITTGDRHAIVASFPALAGAWSITPADRQANITSYPEVA